MTALTSYGRAFRFIVFAAVGCLAAGAGVLAQPAPTEYDATGAWDGVLTIRRTGDEGHGVLDIVQDGDGNLVGTAEGDPGTYTFTRLGGGGSRIVYRLSVVAPAQAPGECGRDLTGIARLDTETESMDIRVRGVIDDCSIVEILISLTKQSD